MNEHDPMSRLPLDCTAVDELAGAITLGALEPDESRAVNEHLATCTQPHEELRTLLGANAALAASTEPVTPSAGLRDRLMATIASTPQEVAPAAPAHSTAEAPPPPPRQAAPSAQLSLPWWRSLFDPRSAGFARGFAVVAVAGVIVLAAVNLSLRGSLDDRQATLDRVASALSGGSVAYHVKGAGGSGFVIQRTSGPVLVAAVRPAPAGHIYEMWLLDAAGKPVSAGTFTTNGEIVAVPLEGQLAGHAIFAVTLEAHRVNAPTTTPIIAGPIGT